MKKLCLLLLLGLTTLFCDAQNISMNQGGTEQMAYFSVIDYEVVREKIIVKASLNGKSYRFIVDTGAPNMITKRVFNELQPAQVKKIPVGDANGKADSLSLFMVDEFKLGDVVFKQIPTLVSNDPFIFDCHQVDGFIGSNMLRNSIVRFSQKDHQLTLTDQVEKLLLNKKQASDLFLTPVQSSPYFTLKAKGKNKGSIQLLFDTGMEGMFDLALKHFAKLEKEQIFEVLAKSRGLGVLGLNGIGTDTTKYRLRVAELTINGALLKNVPVQTTPNNNSRIGAELLKYGVVTVDYQNKKFYFEPFDTSVDLFETSFPVSITLKNNKAIISTVWDEKLKTEINLGDELIAIDEINYKDIDPCHLITKPKMFEGKTQATLTLGKANGEVKKVTISRSIQ